MPKILRAHLMHDKMSPIHFVIPGLTKPAPDEIRRNPVFFWIPAFAGMTTFAVIHVPVQSSLLSDSVFLPSAFYFFLFRLPRRE
jgi:hypothetical protein